MTINLEFQFIEPEIIAPDEKVCQPASYIRKKFILDQKVEKATLYMTALGVYKAYFNGNEVDEQYLLPGFTNYKNRVQYQTYDVTDKLNYGENVIAVILGDGWYRGSLGINSKRQYYGDKIKFAAVLKLEIGDEIQWMKSDVSWKATQNGAIRQNDIKTFETIDMTKEITGWKDQNYDDSGWQFCKLGNYSGKIVPHCGEKILEKEKFNAKVHKTPKGETVLDFGQNHAGHVRFTVTGKAGTTVTLTMGETLDENGEFTLKNLNVAGSEKSGREFGQKLTYTLKEGTQTYKSIFLVSGYRYVKLENWPEPIREENFESIAIYSDLQETGQFSCSNEKINQFVQNVKWSQKSNFVDIPTDCPTRERAGWSGDINVFSETACYFTDTRKFLKKWLQDFISLQKEDGSLPFIIPEVPIEGLGNKPYSSAGWSDALCNIAMVLYEFYDEKEILSMVYEAAKKYVEYDISRAKNKSKLHFYKTGKHYKYILDTGYHWGEWLEPGSSMIIDGLTAMLLPDAEVTTAWLYYSTLQVSQMADLLGKKQDFEKYKALASKIRQAYQKEFLKNGMVKSKRHCRYVRPIAMGLVDKAQAKKIAEELNRKCIENNYKIGTGFLTTYKVLAVLSDYGYVDTAYKMLENEECPGWLYEVNKGATTTWENWYGINEQNVPKDSLNHYAPGAMAAWLFQYCVGIRASAPGFSKITIQPFPGGRLKWAKGSYNSCKGTIISEWKIENEILSFHVVIPDGVEAKIVLPNGSETIVNGGEHDYGMKWEKK